MKISVIIPVFNRIEFLEKTLISVVSQTYDNIEIVVVDDGSNEKQKKRLVNLISLIQENTRINLNLFHQPNSGAPAARNLGVFHSSGDLIQFLDSDDILHKDKFRKSVEIFKKHESIDIVDCYRADMDEFDQILENKKSGFLKLEHSPFVSIIALSRVWTALPIFRSKFLKEQSCAWRENLKAQQDWVYISEAVLKTKNIKTISETLAYCRSHNFERISNINQNRRDKIEANMFASFYVLRAVIFDTYNRKTIVAILYLLKKMLTSWLRLKFAA